MTAFPCRNKNVNGPEHPGGNEGDKKMKQYIFGHRGASGYAPENTLEAFSLAAEMGADGVELDVHLTKDGELVVTHDERIDRVSDGSGLVADMTLAELKKFRFNRTFPEYEHAAIPTLKEVFELLAPTGLMINAELKNGCIDYPDLEKKVIELAAKENFLDRLIFSSFNHYSMRRVKEIDKHLYCGLLYDATLFESWNYAAGLGMDALHPQFWEPLVIGGESEAAHRAGIEINTWTVNGEDDIRRVLRAGVDRVISNYPDRALRILREENAK